MLTGDVHGDERALARLLEGHAFDAVVDFIAFTPEDIERDIRLFSAKTRQFVFISSASAYQTPPEQLPHHRGDAAGQPVLAVLAGQDRLRAAPDGRAPLDAGSRSPSCVRPTPTGRLSCPSPSARGNTRTPSSRACKRGDPIIVHGDGTSLWVVTWNADLAVGLVGLLGRDDAVGEAFHITSDEVLTWNQITAEVGGALGVEPNVVHIPSDLIAAYDADTGAGLLGDKTHSVVFDNTKIKRFVPEFDCQVPFHEGVRRLDRLVRGGPSPSLHRCRGGADLGRPDRRLRASRPPLRLSGSVRAFRREHRRRSGPSWRDQPLTDGSCRY